MKNKVLIVLFALAIATPALAQDVNVEPAAAAAPASVAEPVAAVNAGPRELIVSSDGRRIGRVMRLTADGSPRVIFASRIVTIPASTLTRADGRLVTSLTRAEVGALD